jgi:hypothetical protein
MLIAFSTNLAGCADQASPLPTAPTDPVAASLTSRSAVTTVLAGGASHTEFTSVVIFVNPCNGEAVTGQGPTKIVYLERDGHAVVHWTFRMPSAVGDKGNTYRIQFVANEQFDVPSGSSGNVNWFDLRVHSEVITEGDAPNYDWDLGIRVFVVNGTPTGSQFIGPHTTTCHG